jgi:AAA15 family ATPase/GTPase
MKIVHLWKEEKEKFDELKELLGQNGLSIINDIRIDSFELKGSPDDAEEQTYYFINFYPNLESNAINKRLRYSNLSYGTKRVLRMLTAMLHDNSTVLLLEQPEDGVHSGLLNKLVPLLQSYVDPSQFIVTSHASGIIDKLSAKDIRLVAMKDAKTIARALNKKELDAIDSFICEEGSLSDFLESIGDD